MPRTKRAAILLIAFSVLLIMGLIAWLLAPDSKLPERMPGHETWSTASSGSISFQYPSNFGTMYIDAFDWPPKVQEAAGPFSCTEAGLSEERAGKTERRTINGREYCVTEVVGAAAGSLYTQYAYAMPFEDRVLFFTFTTRASQCANYDETQKSVCETERAAFSVDALMDEIAQTVRKI